MFDTNASALRVPPTAAVIFGATGDLTHRKIIPAFYHLAKNGHLPDGFSIIGFARREKDDLTFRQELKASLDKFAHTKPVDEKVWKWLESRIFYQVGDLPTAADYVKLAERLKTLPHATTYKANYLFYLATAPNYFCAVAENLFKAGLAPDEAGTTTSRLIVEKPFGEDLPTAQKLNRDLVKYFPEKTIYRIDHYLGKETVQNLLYFRFGNSIYEPLWDSRYIDHVQITVAEKVSVEGRGGYYEGAGASRDMVQNHLMQLFSLIAMEPPARLEAENIRDEKVKVLKSITMPSNAEILKRTVRAQYGGGLIDGRQIPPYRQEEKVDPNSMIETYVAMRLEIDNWRWHGVPFYLRTGKALQKQFSEISIIFKRPPSVLFAANNTKISRNWLRIRIQPDEGIHLHFNAKVPSQPTLKQVEMSFNYRESGQHYLPEAYERLICDAMLGESTLFTRADEVEEAWRIIDSVRAAWANEDTTNMPLYSPGSMGPVESDELLRRDGRSWARPM